jgi:hypothetical protein
LTGSALDARLERREPCRVISARLAGIADLTSLLELFAASEVSAAVEPRERAEEVWRETLEQRGV